MSHAELGVCFVSLNLTLTFFVAYFLTYCSCQKANQGRDAYYTQPTRFTEKYKQQSKAVTAVGYIMLLILRKASQPNHRMF